MRRYKGARHNIPKCGDIISLHAFPRDRSQKFRDCWCDGCARATRRESAIHHLTKRRYNPNGQGCSDSFFINCSGACWFQLLVV
jgi:hypothetical protein